MTFSSDFVSHITQIGHCFLHRVALQCAYINPSSAPSLPYYNTLNSPAAAVSLCCVAHSVGNRGYDLEMGEDAAR